MDQHHGRSAAGDPVDHASPVQRDLPLLELRRDARHRERLRGAAGTLPAAVFALAGDQLGTSRRTLAKGSYSLDDAAPGHDPDQPLLREGALGRSSARVSPTARSATFRGSTSSLPGAPGGGRHRARAGHARGRRSATPRRSSNGSIGVSSPSSGCSRPSPSERERVEALCRRLDEQLGPCGRRLMYVQHVSRARADAAASTTAACPPGRTARSAGAGR